MNTLSFDKMATIEGGDCAPSGKYCPLALLVLFTGFKSRSLFAVYAGFALAKVLCTPCGGDFPK
jgi:hypothetical protein